MYNLETLQISSTFPCLVVYLLDQSGSMEEMFGTERRTKAQKVAEAINEVIFETGLKCFDSSGNIKNRFELSVIGYGNNSRNTSEAAWEGNLKGHWVVSIADVFQNPIGEFNGIPVWISPKSGYMTPMNNAFENAYRVCEAWINWGNHKECHPPIVINITDGEATDGGYSNSTLKETVQRLKNLRTHYGSVNVFNIHISTRKSDSVLFPSQLNTGAENAKLLFELSTELNPQMVALANRMGYEVQQGAKGYIFNGSAKNLMDFLNIGSNPL
jgi:hypothetical protein